MASLSLRIRLDHGMIGPGKVELLEKIHTLGSISRAGRAMGMPYRRAWELTDELNSLFAKPLVDRKAGGRHGGGAVLTNFGISIIEGYRRAEMAATQATSVYLRALQAGTKAPPSEHPPVDTALMTPSAPSE